PAIWIHGGRLKRNRTTAATPPGSGDGPTVGCWSTGMAVPYATGVVGPRQRRGAWGPGPDRAWPDLDAGLARAGAHPHPRRRRGLDAEIHLERRAQPVGLLERGDRRRQQRFQEERVVTPFPAAGWAAKPLPRTLPLRKYGRSSVAASAAFQSVPLATVVVVLAKLSGAESAAVAPGRSARATSCGSNPLSVESITALPFESSQIWSSRLSSRAITAW